MRPQLKSLIGLFLFLGSATVTAQNPIHWTFAASPAENGLYNLVITGEIEDGWATYSQFLESQDGPIATSLTFTLQPHFELQGKAEESGEIVKTYDKIFDMNLSKFKHKAIFTQKVKVNDPSKPIEGFITYMACNDEMCLPPRDVDFKIKL